MPARETGFAGLMLLDGRIHVDERGSSRKVVTREQLSAAGLEPHVEEVLTVTNVAAGTLRGMHFQDEPFSEAKTIWVTKGAMYDVVVDLRRDQPTFGQTWSGTLSDGDDWALHVPRGFAHGYQTLEDDTHVAYLISAPYSAGHGRTLAWDDPQLAIDWPRPVSQISSADQRGLAWADLFS